MLQPTAQERRTLPGFCTLLDSLAERLDESTFVSRTTQRELAGPAVKARDDQRLLWLEQLTLYECVSGLVEDHMCSQSRLPEADVLDLLEHALSTADARQLLLGAGGETVMGVRSADLEGADATQRNSQVAVIQRTVIPMVESRLQRKLAMVASFAGAPSVASADLSRVLQDARDTARLRERLGAEAAQLNALYVSLTSLQESVVTELCDALQAIKFGKVCEWDSVYAQWLVAQADAMAAKMRLLELRFLKDTYTSKEAMSALRKIDAEIEQSRQALADRKSELAQRRARFTQAGLEEMARLAREYSQVLKSTEETRWAINELASAK